MMFDDPPLTACQRFGHWFERDGVRSDTCLDCGVPYTPAVWQDRAAGQTAVPASSEDADMMLGYAPVAVPWQPEPLPPSAPWLDRWLDRVGALVQGKQVTALPAAIRQADTELWPARGMH